MVRISNTKNKHNTKDLAIKTSSRPKKSKKLAVNQENRFFYATHIPFGDPEGVGVIGRKTFFFSKVAHLLPPGTCQVWGPLKSRFCDIKTSFPRGVNTPPPVTVRPLKRIQP